MLAGGAALQPLATPAPVLPSTLCFVCLPAKRVRHACCRPWCFAAPPFHTEPTACDAPPPPPTHTHQFDSPPVERMPPLPPPLSFASHHPSRCRAHFARWPTVYFSLPRCPSFRYFSEQSAKSAGTSSALLLPTRAWVGTALAGWCQAACSAAPLPGHRCPRVKPVHLVRSLSTIRFGAVRLQGVASAGRA